MTDVRSFQSLHDRLAGVSADETLYDDVPSWLDQPLHDWLKEALQIEGQDRAERLAKRALMRLRWAKEDPGHYYSYRLRIASGMDLLMAIDAILQLHPKWDIISTPLGRDFQFLITSLQEVLIDSGSLYRVDLKGRCLVRRVDPIVQESVEKTINGATPTTAGHLRQAWLAAYGVSPDPDKSYDEAVLAVEEICCPLVSPNNSRATLGTVIADLRNQSSRWELRIVDTSTGQPASISSVIDMLNLLWKTQSRHGGNANSRRQTQVEAEFAVHMAAALTQWLSTGLLYRKP